ncbi:hypothetical protein MYAER_3381 [Microcystis aeruginosa NIES-2549]|uniref:Uncharacterized protein n=1 Tax=Microcystis aeruginosa NIES-2549 TaxID=1641812 RepID=A0A0F6U713_MICAE|nr:hypothetical protein [Microcystis aeruginosa]AKE65719.1 hypothetical protein MYAER_3381 [Microcystis aeruginosa NIES-2549]AOC54123.1 hypothetical protein amyaer_3418 [Microcystis aeruginosa NIES-2481]
MRRQHREGLILPLPRNYSISCQGQLHGSNYLLIISIKTLSLQRLTPR